MNTPSASRAEPVLVWDLPVRIFHWLLAASFAGAWLTAESESWRLVHVTLGYTMLALVALRIVWGFAGTRHARFADFVKGPSAVVAYVKSIVARRPAHFVGHNPAGAIAILALLALTLVVGATGYGAYSDAGHWLEEVHEAAANTMLAVVIVHIAGVVIGSIVHRENLVRAMFTGRKQGQASDAIPSVRWGAAVALLAVVAGLWWFQSQQGALQPPPSASRHGEAKEADD
jgi:cytochrome b